MALLQTNVAQDEKFAVDRMPETLAWVAGLGVACPLQAAPAEPGLRLHKGNKAAHAMPFTAAAVPGAR